MVDVLDGAYHNSIERLIKEGLLDEADRLCQEGLARCPAFPPFWCLLGDIEEARGDRAAAIRVREAAIQAIHATNDRVGPSTYLDAHEGAILCDQGRYAEACEPLERLADQDPPSPLWLLGLGEAFAGQERFVDARITWERALRAAPSPGLAAFIRQRLEDLAESRQRLITFLEQEGVDLDALPDPQCRDAAWVREVLQAGDLDVAMPLAQTGPRPLFDLAFRPKGGYWGWDESGRVTIARAFVNSTGGDYIVFWAQRRPGGGFDYGGYDVCTEIEATVPIVSSDLPLSLGELFFQMEAADPFEELEDLRRLGPLKAVLAYNLESNTPAKLTYFIQVESRFYPEAPALFRYELGRFLRSRRRLGPFLMLGRLSKSITPTTTRRVEARFRQITLLHGQIARIRSAHER